MFQNLLARIVAPAGSADSLANSPRPRVEAPAKLHVHVWPIGENGHRRTLAESPIVSQPVSVAELLVSAKYQRLLLTYVFPPMWKVGGQYKGVKKVVQWQQGIVQKKCDARVKFEVAVFLI